VIRLRPIGLVLAAAVGWFPVAPPEHVHEGDDHGHQHVLVHRHAEAHHAPHDADAHDGVFDDRDDPVLTLDSVYGPPIAPMAISVPPSSAVALVEPPAVDTLHRAREYVERLNHGPPRASTSPRAPPSISHL